MPAQAARPVSLFLVSAHGTQDLDARADERVLDCLTRNQIPWSAVSMYTKSAAGGELTLFPCLEKQVSELPSDVHHNESQKRRALASLPWAAGREPFASSEEARKILSQ